MNKVQTFPNTCPKCRGTIQWWWIWDEHPPVGGVSCLDCMYVLNEQEVDNFMDRVKGV